MRPKLAYIATPFPAGQVPRRIDLVPRSWARHLDRTRPRCADSRAKWRRYRGARPSLRLGLPMARRRRILGRLGASRRERPPASEAEPETGEFEPPTDSGGFADHWSEGFGDDDETTPRVDTE